MAPMARLKVANPNQSQHSNFNNLDLSNGCQRDRGS
jgi:hypothetical protein